MKKSYVVEYDFINNGKRNIPMSIKIFKSKREAIEFSSNEIDSSIVEMVEIS